MYGELDRYSIEIDIKLKIISIWAKIICVTQSKTSRIMYSLSHHLSSQQNVDIKWIKFIEKILNEADFSIIFKSIEWLKRRLLDQYLQDWNSSVHYSRKAFNCKIVKADFKFEEYFNILDEQNSLLLCIYRNIGTNKLPIEKGR